MVRGTVAACRQQHEAKLNSIGIIVFVRYDSRRLPGKALRGLGGRPVLGHVLDRARLVPGGHLIVVATSDRAVDDPVATFAQSDNVEVFRGAANDVAARALACAEAFGFGSFVRICGDSPFFDPGLAARVFAAHGESRADVTTNIFPRSYPPGTSVEIIATEAMRSAVKAMTDEYDKEHVTSYFYGHPAEFVIRNVAAEDRQYDEVHLAVDTLEDLKRAESVVNGIPGPPERATLDQVVALARAHDHAISQRTTAP